MVNDHKDKNILDNIKLVKYIASKYFTKSIGIEYEDLVSYGTIGLIDAANTYKSNRNCKFSTYASLKIKAAIIDEIRKNSPISRNDVTKINKYNNAIEYLQNNLLREPNELEIANYLKLSIDEVNKIENSIHIMTTTSLDSLIFQQNSNITIMDTIRDNDDLSPENIIEREEKLEILTKAIDMLKEKDRLVLSLYYYEGFNLKEIGKVLEVSESRVSQLHSRAIVNLKNAISKLNYNIA